MSNPIPPGAIPKLFKLRNADGKEIGNWRINIKQKPVNLRTQDYMLARERARQAFYEGKRDFADERSIDVPLLTAIPETFNRAPIAPDAPKVSGDWTSDVTAAAGAGLKPEVFPPEPTGRPRDAGNPIFESPTPIKESSPNGDKSKISPEMIEGIIKQAAQVLVEIQIQGQEYLWARWGKIQAGKVPENHDSRKIPLELWEQAIREWIPPELPIPPWLLAPIICAAMTVPVQIEGSTPLKKPTDPAT